MKVTVVRGGGLAGMTTRTQLDSNALPEGEAQTLSSYVQGAALHEGGKTAAAPATPDDLLYEISVDDGGTHVTQRYREDSLPDDIRQLVQWIDSRPERSFGLDR
jgi:hypothetical protein